MGINLFKKKPTSWWNHRIMVEKKEDILFFTINEVYYNEGKPNAYSNEDSIVYEYDTSMDVNEKDIKKSIKRQLKYMRLATKKPILWKGDRFSEIFKI